jgi:hypothetical protein
MRSLLTRLKELVRAAKRFPQVEPQIGYLTKLPREYEGERHIVSVGRLADGNFRWEERPGTPPANNDDSDAPMLIRVIAVPSPVGRA